MVTKITQNMINAQGPLDVLEIKSRLNQVRMELYGSPTRHKQKQSFAPSNMGFVGQCPRHWYYAFNGATYTDKFDPESSSAMENGKDTHKRVEREYELAFDADVEIEFTKDEPPIRGYADVIVNANVRALGDIKTVKDEKFRRIEASLKPDPGNKLQVLMGMDALGIDHGFLHYIAKSSHEELFFPFAMTPSAREALDKIYSWMSMVHENAIHGELPMRPYKRADPHCKYCPIFNQCWKQDEDGHLKIPHLEIGAA